MIQQNYSPGDLVVTPSGRIAKVGRSWPASRTDPRPRIDLTYTDTGEAVRIDPSLLELHRKAPPPCPRKNRCDAVDSRRVIGGAPLNPLPAHRAQRARGRASLGAWMLLQDLMDAAGGAGAAHASRPRFRRRARQGEASVRVRQGRSRQQGI